MVETSSTDSFKRPAKLIEIYEHESCPFCRKVISMTLAAASHAPFVWTAPSFWPACIPHVMPSYQHLLPIFAVVYYSMLNRAQHSLLSQICKLCRCGRLCPFWILMFISSPVHLVLPLGGRRSSGSVAKLHSHTWSIPTQVCKRAGFTLLPVHMKYEALKRRPEHRHQPTTHAAPPPLPSLPPPCVHPCASWIAQSATIR